MAKAPTTYVPNTTAARTRKVDNLTFPLLARPQAMTVYVRFIEMGLITEAAAQFVFNIGGGSAPQFNVIRAAGQSVYMVRHFNDTSNVSSSLAAAPTVGQLVELCAQLYGNGSVQIHQSINGGTVSSATASGALAFALKWNTATLAFAQDGSASFVGAVAIRDCLVIRGVHDLATMRKRVGIA